MQKWTTREHYTNNHTKLLCDFGTVMFHLIIYLLVRLYYGFFFSLQKKFEVHEFTPKKKTFLKKLLLQTLLQQFFGEWYMSLWTRKVM